MRVRDVGYHDFWAYQVVNRLWARNAFGKLNFKNENLPLSTGSFMEDPLIFPESDGFGLGDSGQFGFLACQQTSKQCEVVLKCNMGRNRLNVTQESIQFETRDWGQNCISPSLIQSVSKQLLHSHGEIEVMVVKNCIGVWRRHDHDSRAAGRVSRNLDTLRVKLSSTHVGVAYFVNTLGSIASLDVSYNKPGRLILIQIPREADYFWPAAMMSKVNYPPRSCWDLNLTEVRGAAQAQSQRLTTDLLLFVGIVRFQNIRVCFRHLAARDCGYCVNTEYDAV